MCSNPDKAVGKCLSSLNLTIPSADSVERCARSEEGRALVRMHAQDTKVREFPVQK